MDATSREKFWNTLLSLNGTDIAADSLALKEVIQYPSKLYRFRPVSFSSLDALLSNKMYFARADHYDDPFDSHVFIDSFQNIESILRTGVLEKERWTSYAKDFVQSIGIPVEELSHTEFPLDMEKTIQEFLLQLREVQTVVQKELFTICFTESVLNEQLWLKYAQNHSGFVLEYDLADDSYFLCGKKESCACCIARNLTYSLYPVYYATEPYNATAFAQKTLLVKILASKNYFLDNPPPALWEREKISLIKKKCHEHDEEWRLIYPGYPKNRPYICWRPCSVTIGLRTKASEKNLITVLSKVAGIPLIYECYTENGDLKRRVIYQENNSPNE